MRTVTASPTGYASASEEKSVTDGGSVTADFSLTPAVTATSVNVSSVTYATAGRRGRDLLITIALADNLGDPVVGAGVSIYVSRDDSFYGSGTASTGSSGSVTFKAKNAPPGTYTTTVTNVAAGSLTWDGVTPPNSFDK